jgi:peroxiredoxin
VGAKAPDFTLPDGAGKPHKLSDMVRRDTLLYFICGCANCIFSELLRSRPDRVATI